MQAWTPARSAAPIKSNTALAFVSLKADGNRDFSFYRKPSADMLLEPEQLEEAWFANTGVLHFGSVSLIDAPIQKTHRRAISLAKEHGAIVSFDPNIRLRFVGTPETCQARVREFLPFADIVKLSDEELEFVTGESDIRQQRRSCLPAAVRSFCIPWARKALCCLPRRAAGQRKIWKSPSRIPPAQGMPLWAHCSYCLTAGDDEGHPQR